MPPQSTIRRALAFSGQRPRATYTTHCVRADALQSTLRRCRATLATSSGECSILALLFVCVWLPSSCQRLCSASHSLVVHPRTAWTDLHALVAEVAEIGQDFFAASQTA